MWLEIMNLVSIGCAVLNVGFMVAIVRRERAERPRVMRHSRRAARCSWCDAKLVGHGPVCDACVAQVRMNPAGPNDWPAA